MAVDPARATLPRDEADASPLRCPDPEAEAAMIARIDEARSNGDTIGGVFEVVAHGLPIGLGRYVQWDRRLDAALAAAVMSINIVKGVEFGLGFEQTRRFGSAVHDVIEGRGEGGRWIHRTNNAGGLTGGVTNGEPLVVRGAVKPISTLAKPLPSADLLTGEAVEKAHYERSDISVVPAAGVVGEAMVMLVLADAMLDKFGGDSLAETRDNLERYRERISHPVADSRSADAPDRRRRRGRARAGTTRSDGRRPRRAARQRQERRRAAARPSPRRRVRRPRRVDRASGRPEDPGDLRRGGRGRRSGRWSGRPSRISGAPDPEPAIRRVVATGGGAVVDPRNRWALYRGRLPIWLDGRPEVLAQRLRRSPNVRPLVTGRDPIGAIRSLARERERFYAAGHRLNSASEVGTLVDRVDELAAGTAVGRDGARAGTRSRGAGVRPPPGGHGERAHRPRRGDRGHGGGRRARPCPRAARDPRLGARRLGGRRRGDRRTPGGRRLVDRAGHAPGGRGREAPGGHRGGGATSWPASGRNAANRIVAIGGGALGDAAGFLAATWLRGVPLIHVPTTLVAQIDSSIGGKTGVDLPEGKNLVGAFHQPTAVIIDIAFLRSLPERQRRAALGEAVKMAALGDERLFALLETDGEAIASGDAAAFDSGAVAEVVERAAWAKVVVVTADEREQGDAGRISLNLGHSLGHAVEAAGGFGELLHGEAVAVGLRAAVRIGSELGVTPPDRAARIERLLTDLGLATAPLPYPLDAVLGALATDKKHAGGQSPLGPADGRRLRGPGGRPGRARRARRGRAAGAGRRRLGRPAVTRVLVLQGPNLNLIGTREPEIYGHDSLDDIHAEIAARAEELGLEVEFFQSNHEGALIDRLHGRDFDAAIVNAGGLTHTSVALRDALLGIQRPFWEVHLSDPATREPFRQVNFLRDVAAESIVGQGKRGYLLALESIARHFAEAPGG